METEKANFNHWSKKKRLMFKFLLVAIGLFFGLLITEIFLRVTGYSYPMFYQTDTTRGYALSPNMKGWYRKEGKSYVEINSDGLRDEEHSIAKPDNTIRIALVGDSYPEAFQVSLEEAFWKIMQRKLRECGAFGGKQIEIINFGVSGYGTAQEFITLREQVWKYSPDIVILAMTTNNDITDNSRHFKKTEIPYFVYRDNRLTLDESFRDSVSFKFNDSILSRTGFWLQNNLRVIQAFQEARTALKYKYNEWKNKPTANQQSALILQSAKPSEIQKIEDIGIDNQIYRPPNDEFWNEAWRVTEGILGEMNNEVQSKGAKFWVVTLSNGIQVHPNPAARTAFLKKIGAEDLLYPDKRIKAFADTQGITAVNLAPELLAYAEQNQIYLHGFGDDIGNGHWNQIGHLVAGEILGGKICQGILK